MRTSEPKAGEKIKSVRIDEDTLTVDLADGRTVSTPLAWYPRLLHATSEQRNNFVISGAGFGIHWPELDEDLSVHGMLAGAAAPGIVVAV
ncbi:MAG TPA: DUF2442 domain-containing protein [Thermoanaerobaculia bacterium]|nr:DUF2442 domain-containing protein [Thermoanaerobaculia bacterium]